MKFKSFSPKNIHIFIIATCIISIFLIIVFDYEKQEEVNFENIYSEIEKISYQIPKKVNMISDNVIFYLPKGYNRKTAQGIFLETSYATLEIIPQKIKLENVNNSYSINEDEEIIYNHVNLEHDTRGENYTQMIVWAVLFDKGIPRF